MNRRKAVKDIPAVFLFVTYRLAIFLAAFAPYLLSALTFDIYRFQFVFVMARIAAETYAALAAAVAVSLVFGFSLLDILKIGEEYLAARPLRELFPGGPPGEGRFIRARRSLSAIAYSAALTIFLFIALRLIVAACNYPYFLIIGAICVIFPAALVKREWKRELLFRAAVFAAPALAALAAFFAFGLDLLAPIESRGAVFVYAFWGGLLFAVVVSGYLPHRSGGAGFAKYFFDRLMLCYRIVFLLGLLAVGVFFMFILAILSVALTFIYYRLWAVGAVVFAAVGYLMFRLFPARRFRNLLFFLIFLQIFAQVFIYVRWPVTERQCDTLPDYRGEVKPALTPQRMLDDEKAKGDPYDTVYDSESDRLLVSFKNRAGHGALMLLAPGRGRALDTVSTFHAADPGRIMYPERLAIDTVRKRFYASVKSPSRFTLLAGSYANDRITITKRLYFGREEITNVIVLPEKDLIGVLFLATPIPSIRFYRPDTFELVRRVAFDEENLADYMAYDPNRDRLLFAAHAWLKSLVTPHIYYVDMRDFSLREVRIPELKYRLRTFFGIQYDPVTDRIFVSSPLSHQILVLDGATFKVVKEVPTGDHARKMSVAPRAGLLFVTCYGDNSVDVMDTKTNKIIRTYNLGPRTHSVTVDPLTERVFAASGCGVYELSVDRRNRFPVNRYYRMFYIERFPAYIRELRRHYEKIFLRFG